MSITQNKKRAKADYDMTYEAGRKAMWDRVLVNGTRTNAEYIFYHWSCEYLHPPYKFTPTTRNIYMFGENRTLKKIEAQYFDLSQCSTSDTAATQGNYATFGGCYNLEEIEDVGMKAGYYYRTFANCPNLKTIAVVRSNEQTRFESTFSSSRNLVNIFMEGVIGQNGFDIRHSTNLSKASIESIITHLSDITTGLTVTLSETACRKAFHVPDGEDMFAGSAEWCDLVFSKPNWSIALA